MVVAHALTTVAGRTNHEEDFEQDETDALVTLTFLGFRKILDALRSLGQFVVQEIRSDRQWNKHVAQELVFFAQPVVDGRVKQTVPTKKKKKTKKSLNK